MSVGETSYDRINDYASVKISLARPHDIRSWSFGEVKKPGAYQLDRPMNVLEAIIVAGGFTDKAAPARTRVIRNGPDGEQVIYVDVNDLLKRRQRGKVILLQENDVVLVPQSFF